MCRSALFDTFNWILCIHDSIDVQVEELWSGHHREPGTGTGSHAGAGAAPPL